VRTGHSTTEIHRLTALCRTNTSELLSFNNDFTDALCDFKRISSRGILDTSNWRANLVQQLLIFP